MVIRQVKRPQYQKFCAYLEECAEKTPLDASCTVEVRINGAEYRLKLQPEKRGKIALLQAVKITWEDSVRQFELITKGNLLAAILDLLMEEHTV